MKTTSEYIALLRKYMAENAHKYGIVRMGIFGSVARGEQTENSDVDVCVEGQLHGFFALAGIKQELEELLGRCRSLPQADLECCLLVLSAPAEPMAPAALLSSLLCFPGLVLSPAWGLLALLAHALLAQLCCSQTGKLSCPPALP